MWMREINGNTDGHKEDLNKWINLPCSWIRRINIKRSVLYNSKYRVDEIPIKMSVCFFEVIDRLILRFIFICKGIYDIKNKIEKVE